MLNKENNEKKDFNLEVSLKNQVGDATDPLFQEKNDMPTALESNALNSKAKEVAQQESMCREQNLNAHESLINDSNLSKTNRLLEQSDLIVKKNNVNPMPIEIPLINFSTINHTLKQTIYPLKQDITEQNNINQSSNDGIATQDSKITLETNILESQTTHIPFPAVYTKENTEKQADKRKKKQGKNIKKKRNPLVRLSIFFVILCCITIAGYKILVHGIFIKHLQFGNIAIHNIFLQLQNKLVLEIATLDLSGLNRKKDDVSAITPTFNEALQSIINYTQRTLYVLSYFERLNIEQLRLPNNHQWNIDYANTNYRVQGTLFDANFAITNNQNNLYLKIDKFQLKTIPLHFGGELIYSIPKKQFLFDINAIKDQNIKEYITLKGVTNFRDITLHAHSTPLQDIQLIRPFIENMQNKRLQQTLQNWIFDNIEYENMQLADLYMHIQLENIGETLLHNTKASIIVENPKVYLAKNIKPILAKQTTLTLQDANLKIVPLEATFAGMDLSNSEILIANMPHSDFILELNGKNMRFDTNMAKILAHYGVVLPLTQQSLARNTIKTKKNNVKTNNATQIQQAINNTEDIVKNALKSKQTSIQANISQLQSDMETKVKPTATHNENLYAKILELNPDTTLTNELLYNPNLSQLTNSETIGMHLKIEIKHNEQKPTKPLFSLQGIIQAQNTALKLYDIPLKANSLNIALDITPSQKLVYINGNRVKWQRLIEADANVLLDLNKQYIQANTYIHSAILNTNNLKDLKLMPNTPTTTQQHSLTNIALNNISNNIAIPHGTQYMQQDSITPAPQHTNDGIYFEQNTPNSTMQANLRQFGIHTLLHTNTQAKPQTTDTNDAYKLLENAKKQQLQNRELSQDIIKTLPKKDIKDDGKTAKEDEHVLKDLKNNPVWNDLKIHAKKTRPFQQLSNKELMTLARQEIEKEKDSFSLEQDFLNIKKTNIHLNLSFAQNKITLDVPALSLHLESGKNLQLKITKIENILQFSPLARYYGITHGDFSLQTTPYTNTQKESFKRMDFILNLTKLQHPLYTITHKRVTEVSLKGQLQDNALIVFVNDDIDFKSQDSLSMLRMKGYRINIDEAMQSQIPFFIDLFKDKQKDALPYSEAAISQELKFIAIKNKLRQQMQIKPTDFNIIGENLQFTFLGYTAPFDSVNIRFIDGRIIVDGQYGKGILNASLIKDNVYFRAKNFSGDFINIVLTSLKSGKKMLNGGSFSFDGVYRGGILNASLEIQNTALIEFKSVQNIFALIDTVPSLFMFKDPHISTKGYQVNYGKILFAINSDYIGLQNIFLLGSSMDINGQGIIDIDTQEMNVNLSISTIKNLSKFINKIPVIGYLILGREGQISTNLILSGKYIDPKVNITLATDIIKAPFNILRRVFPVEMLVNNTKDEEEMMLY